jgi:DNA-binding PucR family transcriptional regulator
MSIKEPLTDSPDLEVQPYLDELLSRVAPTQLGEDMADVLRADIAEFADLNDPDFRAGLALSCVENMHTIWDLLRCGPSSSGYPTPPLGAKAFVRELAHRGLPLSALLRAYRLGHAFAEKRLADETASIDMPAEARWQLITFFTQATFEYVDAICTQLVGDYEQERVRWVRGAAAARAEYVQAIIDRRPVDQAAANERLGYDISRRHVAFIVWSDAPDVARRAGWVERAASELAATLGGGSALTIPVGERVVWGWTSGPAVTDSQAGAARIAPGLRAAVGICGEGPAGMADSHDDALATRRVSELLAQRPGSVLHYESCALLALLSAEPARAVRFVETELGPLIATDDASLRLRATLRTYFEEGLSPARTGRRLAIHLNTVVYRVKQAEEILGHSVESRRPELEAALRLAERLPALNIAAARLRAGGANTLLT